MTFVFWGVWFFHALATPNIARTHGAEPGERNRDTDTVPFQASCVVTPYLPAVRKKFCSSCLGLSAVVGLAWACGLFTCLLFDFFFVFESTDVCSHVRQLLKGHLGMESNFYSVIRINSSDFITLVNIYGITHTYTHTKSSDTNLGILSIRLLWTRLKKINISILMFKYTFLIISLLPGLVL